MDNLIDFPKKKYGIIYADPPWSYRDKANAGQRGASFKYPTMSLMDIENLPIRNISLPDCLLFMWTTGPQLNVAFKVIEAWGFKYKTVAFTWIKLNKLRGGFFWGMGNWTRANSEFCLLGVKGKPKRLSASVHSVISSPIELHSKKPDVTRHRIETLCGKIPRIELFARQEYLGWDVWGNEVNK